MLTFCNRTNSLYRGDAVFDAWNWSWQPASSRAESEGSVIELVEAMAWLFRQPRCRRVPVAVIGPKKASLRQIEVAEALGQRLGELRIPMITGGKVGVMEAASRGCLEAGGMPIGILPDEEWTAANDFVTIPLATGLGSARNAIIARAAFALVAVGGEYGTMSEMAFGLHFNRLVLALEDAPEVPGAIRPAGIEAALEHVAARIFALEA